MAKGGKVWNVRSEGVSYKIEFVKNQIIINNGEPTKLRKFKAKSKFASVDYFIPIGGKEAVLHVKSYAQPELVLDGVDCATGKAYVPTKMPGWCWVFIILHAINFGLILGGAIGGALAMLMVTLTMSVAANNKSTGVRVATCIAIWVVSTLVELFIAFLIPGI